MQPEIRRIPGRAGARGLGAITILAAILALVLSTTAAFAAAPSVTQISPASGPAGTVATVFGNSFVPGGTSVTICGIGYSGSPTVTNVTATQLTLTLPVCAQGGAQSIFVQTTGGNSNTNVTFTYTSGGGTSAVYSMSPITGAYGTPVTLTGVGFIGTTSVTFGGIPGTNLVVSNNNQLSVWAPSGSGSVSVIVNTPGGAATSPNLFTYTGSGGSAAIYGISPSVAAPGSAVTVTGTGLSTATAVYFGGIAGTGLLIQNDSQLTVYAPASGTGTVTVTVYTSYGSPSSPTQFTYSGSGSGTVVVYGLSPSTGPIGTPVTITGTGFLGATAVYFGSAVGTSLIVQNNNQLTVYAPSGFGSVVVTVYTPSGSATSPTQFTYNGSGSGTVAVYSISPASGAVGTPVIVTGTGFLGATAVYFGSVAGTSLSVQSNSQLTVYAPSGSGSVLLTVYTPSGTASSPTQFTYGSGSGLASVYSLSPSYGPQGTPVTITGTGFLGTTAVYFGSTVGTNLIVQSNNQLTVTAPYGVGSVTVIVYTTYGPVTSPTQYSYNGSGTGITISSFTPTTGPVTGGNQITLYGAGFTGAYSATFGGVAATITPYSDSQAIVTAPPHADGAVQIVVTGPLGTGTSPNYYTYGGGGSTGPTITSMSPANGPISGGTLVTFYGSGFTGTSSVGFGGSSAYPSVLSDSTMTVTTPAHTAGAVQVQVTNTLGASVAPTVFVYGNAYGPVITSFTPTTGPAAGGTPVTISGSGFSGASAVTFGGISATSYSVLSDNQITANSPSHVSGPAQITVTTITGTGVSTLPFTYGSSTFGPTITSFSPTTGPTSGGTSVIIYGSGFTGTTSVMFGSTSASFTFVSDSQLDVTTPYAATAGVVSITVTATGGVGTAPTQFTYGSGTLPTVTYVTPSSGAAGATVTVTGTGFTGATSVTFGGVAGTGMSVSGDTSIIVTAPSHSGSGAVNVIVTGPGGSSAVTTSSTFTYTGVGATLTYTLTFRWSLIVWTGQDGIPATNALKGTISGATGLSDISSQVTAIFSWNGSAQKWGAFFPGSESTPGANDFTTLSKDTAYWVAISTSGSVSWTTVQG